MAVPNPPAEHSPHARAMQRALLGRRAAGRARMSRGGNMGRCRGATWCVAAALLAAAGTRVARAQQSEAPWTTYAQLRAWVDAFDDLPDLRDSAARLPVVETSGICVTLRRSGRVVGSGVDDAGDTLMARRAIGRALSEVLGHPAVANLPPELRGAGAGIVHFFTKFSPERNCLILNILRRLA